MSGTATDAGLFEPPMPVRPPVARMQSISKAYPAVVALRDVDFDVFAGEVHTLAGENGSGKSTLVKILAGALHQDSGVVEIDGQVAHHATIRSALDRGVALISQELALAPKLSVAENLFLGHRLVRHRGRIDWNRTRRAADSVLRRVELDVEPTTPVGELPADARQLVEIARTLTFDPRVLVMDEPTSSLDSREVAGLFRLIRQLRDEGVAIVFISHRMDEMLAISDRFTVLRDGERVDTALASDVDADWLVTRMVGRSLENFYPARPERHGRCVLTVAHLSDAAGKVVDASFEVCAGEIVGVSGIVGSGRTELVETIFGMRPRRVGEILIDGTAIPSEPKSAIAAGMALVPDDRAAKGAVMTMSVSENVLLAQGRARRLARPRQSERATVDEWCTRLGVRCSGTEVPLSQLSGGNQQKVILARWLALGPKVLLLDEPTRGIDIGGKAEIYRLIVDLADLGVAVVLVSSELNEILAVSERVLVMRGGRIVANLEGQLTEERIVAVATGASQRDN